jgi:hypothetical protein
MAEVIADVFARIEEVLETYRVGQQPGSRATPTLKLV